MTTDTSHFTGLRFMRLGMLALATGMFFGVIGGFQFLGACPAGAARDE